MWHRRETRRTTENTNLDPNLKRIQTTRPELPIGRFLKSMSLGGNRVILAVMPQKLLSTGVILISNPYIALPLIATATAFAIDAGTTDRTSLRIPSRTMLLRQSVTLLFMCSILAVTILLLLVAGDGRSVWLPTTNYFAITGMYLQSMVLTLGIPVLLFISVCLPAVFSEGKGVPTRLRILLLLAIVGSLLYFAVFWTMGVEQWSYSFTFGVAAVNTVILGSLIVSAWLLDRLKVSTFVTSLCIAFPLIVWLCIFGFPYLGHLP